jgi:carbonic anhydrase
MAISFQSPIDLTSPITRAALATLDFRYPAGGLAATAEFRVANGDSIAGRPRAIPQVVVTPPPGPADLHIDGRTYDLQSLHWHSPAEHAVYGRRPPMELHLVHAGPDGGILVVGALFVLANLAADVATASLDPRRREAM